MALSPSTTPAPEQSLPPGPVRTLNNQISGLVALRDALEREELGTAFSQAVDIILQSRGRLAVCGIGKSGHVGRKLQSTLASTGTPSLFIHAAEAAHGDLGSLQPEDVLLVLSNSGETIELEAVLRHALRLGMRRLAITSQPHSTLARWAEVPLIMPATPEACPLGLAPTTSTLMQLAIGDALAMALLEKRGFSRSDFSLLHPAGRLGARLRPVGEFMHKGPTMPLGTADMSLREVIMEMTSKSFGCVGIVDSGGRLVGLVSERDLRQALDRDLDSTCAETIMNLMPRTTTSETSAEELLLLMSNPDFPVSSMFVLDGAGRPQGIVHLHDILRAGTA
ncbi:KpsF/GutQ family sugar-phosphate isomerase [Formicincola oecophyllae]|uniref:KpsF/GutQ family sugar-phosphate isomerase n=1 Tax=Formicincola oecophyllae TaxID=2558361 RepID=A0A4Y6U950_9PROT|nr:KpsF/GutQ family sugar-phosphate isomerase [Formicincola oecophyllae]QDH13902.1 KpsF/GutQ family sugar-phosphate isomerase [Formicincola oecophyllae]